MQEFHNIAQRKIIYNVTHLRCSEVLINDETKVLKTVLDSYLQARPLSV